MNLPCSYQSIRPKKMKSASLPPGVEGVRCWCGDLYKVMEVTDFSDRLGMKFFMCANYEEDSPVAPSTCISPSSPPPLCMYYRWIDTEMPDCAMTEIRERGRRAWASLDLEKR
uniref:GRF-type domain-containing protein n=1 Tax=Hordeum vulgare subsp. vulgare TaxID=112509 RepID=A0A8I6YRM2_HORVV